MAPTSSRTADRWVLVTVVYAGLMLAIALIPLPGPAVFLGVCVLWFALGFTLRSYLAIALVFVVPIWDAIRGTTSGDMGAEWPLDLIVAVPLGALVVTAGIWIARVRD